MNCMLPDLLLGEDRSEVLVINSYHSGYSWSDRVLEGIGERFQSSPSPIHMELVNLDAKRDPQLADNAAFRSQFFKNHGSGQHKMIITVDEDALEFILSCHDLYFSGVPVVFCGISDPSSYAITPDIRQWMTGQIQAIYGRATVQLIQKLHPRVTQVYILTDTTAAGKAMSYAIDRDMQGLGNLTFFHLSGDTMSMDEIMACVRALPPEAVILSSAFSRDRLGTHFTQQEGLSRISKVSAVPIYGLSESALGYGVVGGKMQRGYEHGQITADLAERVLRGERTADIPISDRNLGRFVFDHNEMVRWSIPEAVLPRYASIINEPRYFINSHPSLLWLIVAIILVQAVIILFLVYTRALRRAAENERRIQSDRLQLALGGADLGLWEWNILTNQIHLDARVLEIIGLPSGVIDLDKYDWERLIHPDDLVKIKQLMTSHIAGTSSYYESEYRLKHREGHWVWVRDRGKIVEYTEDNNPLKVAGTFHDITQSKQAGIDLEESHNSLKIANLELKKAVALADSANAAKDIFLANMSHEIRTPLNGVLGIASLLKDTELDTEQHELVDAVINSAEILLVVINDILDFSKIEAGKMIIENNPFNLTKLIHELYTIYSAKAKLRGVHLLIELSLQVPEYVCGDGLRLRQVLSNLLDNAIKFTHEGSVTLHVRMGQGSPSNSIPRIYFAVEDTGIGISDEQQKQLFEPFMQVDGSHSRKYGGTGLGLAIVHQLVVLMGGDVQVSSKQGEGTTFSFDLDLPTVSQGELTKLNGSEVHKLSSRKGGSVLLVEDNPLNQTVARLILERDGYEVKIATNGYHAIDALIEQEFDVVLMDVQMPDMDGYEATRKIRESRVPVKNPHVPIIALTALASTADRARGLEAGMNAYLTKPIRPAELIEAMSNLNSRA